MATCDASQILANAIAAGYDRLSKRDLVAVCVSSLPASTLEASVASLKDSELSEYDTAECTVQALCSSPGSSNTADQILAAAQANKIDQLSRRDLDAVQINLLCTKTNPPCSTPTAPSAPTAKVVTNTTILITWSQPANTGSLITGYTVKWGTVSGVYPNTATVPTVPKSYTITGLTSGTPYFFVVQANSFAGCSSANSNEGHATTTGSAPFGLLVGLAAYWKLDEAAGAVRVDSVGMNNASQGTDTIAQATNAIIGDSANFSGTSTGLQITSNSQLQFGAGISKSFSGWIFPSSLVVEQVILGKWNDAGADREYLLEVAVGGAVNFLARKLDDSATVTVTSAITLAANTWYHVAFGYDDGTNTIWIQVDGETRVTAACTGVRSSNVQFRFGSCVNKSVINQGPWSGLLDEFAMWTRALTSSEVVQLSASYGLAGLQAMNSVGTDNANRWNTKVQSNGGAALSAATVSSFASCVDGLVTDGIYNRIFQINPIAPDSLIAVETPWSRKGNTLTQWTNHNFVIGDLGINGLTGDGATKYLDTGFNASTQIPSQNNASLAFYAYTANSTANGVECGCLNGAVTTGYYLRSNLPATSATVISDVAAEPTVASPGNGYYCGSRTASNRVDIYFANSLTPHASVANSVVAATLAFPNFVQPLFADNFNGAVSSFVNSVLSSSVFALGLSSSQSQSLFNRLQAMLVARGGGFR